MLIFDEKSQPIILDNIHGPTTAEYMWVLDLPMLDFALSPLVMLEEVICPSVQIRVHGFDLVLPAYWNILVYDRDTSQLDVVELSKVAGREFTAMVYGPHKGTPTAGTITVTNYMVEHTNIGPSLNKQQMLCHPINSNEWISVGPCDYYNKYLKGCIVGDLI